MTNYPRWVQKVKGQGHNAITVSVCTSFGTTTRRSVICDAVETTAVHTHDGRPDGHHEHADDSTPQRSDEQRRNEDAAGHRQTVGPRRQHVVDDAENDQRQDVPLVYIPPQTDSHTRCRVYKRVKHLSA